MKRLPYPKSVFFIIGNEFCERFSYYGMRTILILYLTNILLYTDSTAKIFYHTFSMLVYFFPIIGAIISDSWLGKFRTILYVSMIYATGSVLLALTAVEPLHIPKRAFSIVALLLVAIGSGGIKPCVAAFGGDQFVLPNQELQLATFFSLFYFAINAGSLISTSLMPILRKDVHCFGNNSCYPLAFAVPGALMVIAIVVFSLGRPMYKVKKPGGNIFVDVVKCITYAISHRKNGQPVEHWLDRSTGKFGPKLVSDVKAVLKVLVLYIPLPIYWALYDQQGSGWTLQAVRMDGDIGFYTILPDQMQVVNPFLILAFIPLFTYVVYPLLTKCHLLKKPLQRMCCGGFLAAAAFVVSAFNSIALENTLPVTPSAGNAQIRIYDTTACGFTDSNGHIASGSPTSIDKHYVNKDINIPSKTIEVSLNFTSSQENCTVPPLQFTLTESTAYGVFLNNTGASSFTDSVIKSKDGYPLVRTLVSDGSAVTYTYTKKNTQTLVEAGNITLKSLAYVGTYHIDIINEDYLFKLGGTYTVMINSETNWNQVITVTNPNNYHILWLLPQYFIITAAEIMFSITGLEFAYSQAPSSMKSVLQACYLLTTAFGNLIIVLIESASIFEKQSHDFFLYSGLMVADMLIFMWLAIRYKYATVETSDTDLADPEASEDDHKK